MFILCFVEFEDAYSAAKALEALRGMSQILRWSLVTIHECSVALVSWFSCLVHFKCSTCVA